MLTSPSSWCGRVVVAVVAAAALLGGAVVTALPAQAAATVITETFGSSASAAHFTPTGGTWAVAGGQYVLTAPTARPTSGNANLSVDRTLLTGDFILNVSASATATTSHWDDFSIVYGYRDALNYSYASFNEANDDGTNGIFRVAAGKATQLADFTTTITAGSAAAIRVERTAQTVKVFRADTLVGQTTDASFTAGKVGFGTRNDGAHFDDLTVSGTVAATSIYAAGYGELGALGNGTYDNSSTFVKVSGLDDATGIALGGAAGFALRPDGTVYTWGALRTYNAEGVREKGTNTPALKAGLTGITAIAGGGEAGYALRFDGTVYAWGYNDHGQLGNGTTTDSLTPVRVTGLTGITAIAAGDEGAAYALRSDGTVYAWGIGRSGQLGNGTTTDSATPVRVPGLTQITSIASGFSSAYAVRDDGTVRSWGNNVYGGLGDGTTTTRTSPVKVSYLATATAICSGSFSAYALLSDGTVRAWGDNRTGELAIGNTSGKRLTPVSGNGLTGVAALSCDRTGNAYAALADGTVRGWGSNFDIQLGPGTERNTATPVQIPGLSGITALAAANGTVFVLRTGA